MCQMVVPTPPAKRHTEYKVAEMMIGNEQMRNNDNR